MKFISIEKLHSLIGTLQDSPIIYDSENPVSALDLVGTLAEEMANDLTFTGGGDFIHEN